MIRRYSTNLLLMFALTASFVPNALAEPPQAAAKAPSLYTQLGGYDALAAVTDDFTGLAANYAEVSLRPLWDAWLFSTGVPPL